MEFSTAQTLLVKMDAILMIWMTGKRLAKTKHQAISLSRLHLGLCKEIEAWIGLKNTGKKRSMGTADEQGESESI